MERKNLIVTLDENYMYPLKVMLVSLFANNPNSRFDIYFIYDSVSDRAIGEIYGFCNKFNSRLVPVFADEDCFSQSPTIRYYPRAMYYRLLAWKLLPKTLQKALYLDPDILIINPLERLYEMPLGDHLFGACIHTSITGVSSQVNKIRLNNYEMEGYYNSGVLLMNLERQRTQMEESALYAYVEAHKKELLLPDQDVLNGMFSGSILALDDSLYNYDPRKYETYRMLSSDEKNMDWVMKNTSILHFCGKVKPWHKQYRNRFGILYKHYEAIAGRLS